MSGVYYSRWVVPWNIKDGKQVWRPSSVGWAMRFCHVNRPEEKAIRSEDIILGLKLLYIDL